MSESHLGLILNKEEANALNSLFGLMLRLQVANETKNARAMDQVLSDLTDIVTNQALVMANQKYAEAMIEAQFCCEGECKHKRKIRV